MSQLNPCSGVCVIASISTFGYARVIEGADYLEISPFILNLDFLALEPLTVTLLVSVLVTVSIGPAEYIVVSCWRYV